MSGNEAIGALLAQMERCQALLGRIVEAYTAFVEGDLQVLGRKNTSAIVIAELMVDYCTCAETLFLRVSQFFENDLDASRWHADLLEKMILRIEGVREPVVREETAWLHAAAIGVARVTLNGFAVRGLRHSLSRHISINMAPSDALSTPTSLALGPTAGILKQLLILILMVR